MIVRVPSSHRRLSCPGLWPLRVQSIFVTMLPRPVTVFAGVLLLGGLLSMWVLQTLGRPDYWLGVLAVAVVCAVLARSPRTADDKPRDWVRSGEFLCDSCKYDHPDLCSRPERPNATRCPDYVRRGR